MKGKLFVSIYSIILIGLFVVCCYLMTIVNPPRLPESETRRYVDNEMYPRDSLSKRDNPDYGLEKIPEGADADEFRKNLMTRVVRYGLKTEQTPFQSGRRVVPPLWPDNERNVDDRKNNISSSKDLETSSPIKGLRRSVSNKKLNNPKENPGSILLKIVDDSGRNKIEIKFISGENIKTKRLRKNRSSNQLKTNVTTDKISKYKNYDDVEDKVIHIKADDVILLNIVDDSDVLLDDSVLSDTNNTYNMQQLVMNNTDLSYINKTWNNDPALVGLEEVEKKVEEELMRKEMYTFSLSFNEKNTTINSKNLNNQEYNISVPVASPKIGKSLNYTI